MAAKFHERFDIDVGVTEARKRFVARLANQVLERLREFMSYDDTVHARRYVASVLGERYHDNFIDRLIDTADFHQHLQAVEAIYAFLAEAGTYQTHRQAKLHATITHIFELTEMDIGVRWEAGKFLPQGAPLLDGKLVNDPLRWLRAKGYENVVAPYEKGLNHLLKSTNNPALLADVMTDMYEALEALAKVTTGRDADLSATQEQFIKKVKASDAYKRLLKSYIEYANNYRHGANQGTVRPAPSPAEAESFVYLTGIFIRLAMSRE